VAAMTLERREGAMVAAAEVRLPLRPVSQEAGDEPAEDSVNILPADLYFAGDLRRQVAF
jgi:hypothetical protein